MPSASFVTEPGLSREQQTAIDLVIGSERRTYRLWETNAPASYDYDAFTVYGNAQPADGETRFVLVRDFGPQYEESQAIRYRTGLYAAARSDFLGLPELTSTLFGRLARSDK